MNFLLQIDDELWLWKVRQVKGVAPFRRMLNIVAWQQIPSIFSLCLERVVRGLHTHFRVRSGFFLQEFDLQSGEVETVGQSTKS